jgi:hypothetical protein
MVAIVAVALLFWTCVFGIYFSARGVSPLDFFVGAREPYDPALAHWRATQTDAPPGLIREERFLLPEGRKNAAYLEHQVRYRDIASRAITKVEPPKKMARPRSRSIRP